MENWIVLKFGGTSVSSAEYWKTIVRIATDHLEAGRRPFIVCSALKGVTNKLELLTTAALENQHESILVELREQHYELADELELEGKHILADDFQRLHRLAEGISLIESTSPPVEARVLAHGELLSTRLGHAYMQQQNIDAEWHDARKLLQAEPQPNASERRKYLAAYCHDRAETELQDSLAGSNGQVHITQGFIVGNDAGETVLLGRGGSDTSAAYFAARLQAERLEIWTDVPGMFTANPHIIPSARLLRRLGYDEAQELATMGASVLHPRCIGPVQRQTIPLHIRATHSPDVEHTVISHQASEGPQVKALSAKYGVYLISMQTLGMWQQVGFLADVFSIFKRHGISIDLVATSETDVTVSLDSGANVLDPGVMDPLMDELNEYCSARRLGPAAVVSLVGRNLRALLPELGSALEAFDQHNVHLITQASSDLNLSFVIDEEQVERLLTKLHDRLFGSHPVNDTFGPSWQSLLEAPTYEKPPRWWQQQRKKLLHIAEEHSPCYVYNEQTVQQSARSLLKLSAVDRIFYSVKANANASVLNTIEKTGIGFECVSLGELNHLQELFPQLDPSRILFTPNFAPRHEYQAAFDAGAHVTLDNLHPLEAWPELFAGKDLILRVDPGKGRGHHKHVRTAGVQSKFGVALDHLPRIHELADAAGARIVGLHAHVGSGITEPKTWAQIASTLSQQLKLFPDVRVINVGGGLGISERPEAETLDLENVDQHLRTVRESHPGIELWMEPGRFLVAEAGVLLARVTQIKEKAESVQYVGIETGMNSLIRPALYGSYHEIVNLSRHGDSDRITADIVGPICESGDVLGHSRRLPETHEGDVLLIAKTGAYGYSMHSFYNRRAPAGEIYISAQVKT